MTFYKIILHSHSDLRYVALFLLIVTITKSILAFGRKSTFEKKDLTVALFTMITFHIQFLLGVILYFLSPKVQFIHAVFKIEIFRFFTIEHVLMMFISLILITIGYSSAKKNVDKGHKKILIFYTLALLIIIVAIPWPFRHVIGGNWI